MQIIMNRYPALRNRNFRFYFFGQAASMIGTWAQRVAMAWLAYKLTDSVWIVGVVGFAGGVSMLLLSPIGGVLSDLGDRRRLMFITQSLMLAQSIVLIALTLSGLIQPWHLVALALFLGTVTAFDTPIRISLVPGLIEDRADLPNAVALDSLLLNVARVIGPAVAGTLLATLGETSCFALNAVSFLAVLIALKCMHWKKSESRRITQPGLFFLDGLQYIRDTPAVRNALIFAAASSYLINPYSTLMPAIAAELFNGGPREIGNLLSCAGVGALLSVFCLASTRAISSSRLRWIACAGTVASGLALSLLAASGRLTIGMGMMVFVGGGMVAVAATTKMLLQWEVDEEYRGRVMGFIGVTQIGMQSVGSIGGGALAEAIGIRYALLIHGILCLAVAALYARSASHFRVEPKNELPANSQAPVKK